MIRPKSKNNARLVLVLPKQLKKWLQMQSCIREEPVCSIVIEAIKNHKPRLDSTVPPKTNGVKANVSNSN